MKHLNYRRNFRPFSQIGPPERPHVKPRIATHFAYPLELAKGLGASCGAGTRLQISRSPASPRRCPIRGPSRRAALGSRNKSLPRSGARRRPARAGRTRWKQHEPSGKQTTSKVARTGGAEGQFEPVDLYGTTAPGTRRLAIRGDEHHPGHGDRTDAGGRSATSVNCSTASESGERNQLCLLLTAAT
jgi:hypothetical protein